MYSRKKNTFLFLKENTWYVEDVQVPAKLSVLFTSLILRAVESHERAKRIAPSVWAGENINSAVIAVWRKESWLLTGPPNLVA